MEKKQMNASGTFEEHFDEKKTLKLLERIQSQKKILKT